MKMFLLLTFFLFFSGNNIVCICYTSGRLPQGLRNVYKFR